MSSESDIWLYMAGPDQAWNEIVVHNMEPISTNTREHKVTHAMFLMKGMDWSHIKAIPLVLSKQDMMKDTYMTMYKAELNLQHQLPLLKLVANARGKQMLIAARGQHQLHMVIQWQKMLQI